MVVEESVTHANDGLAVAPWVYGNTDARRDIVGIGGNPFNHTEGLFGNSVDRSARCECRKPLDVVPQAIIDRYIATDLPAILRKNAQRLIVEEAPGLANSLIENGRDAQSI